MLGPIRPLLQPPVVINETDANAIFPLKTLIKNLCGYLKKIRIFFFIYIQHVLRR